MAQSLKYQYNYFFLWVQVCAFLILVYIGTFIFCNFIF